jgi:predicted RNA-binding protein with PIN domain
MAEASADHKNIVVVSDDKEIKFFIRSLGSKVMSIEEFMQTKEKAREALKQKELIKPELNYTQVHQINEELKKIWLK